MWSFGKRGERWESIEGGVFDRMFSAAGFSRSKLHELPGVDQQVAVSATYPERSGCSWKQA
jgi:hypothetical protein